MARLEKYQDFVDRVEELGFMPLSHLLEGLPALSSETLAKAWHTGNHETDPWCWKDRAAQEKKLAYGCILGGHKGFISPRMYPIFYTAFHPLESMEERWAAGELKQSTWRLWQLFEENDTLSTHVIRRTLGVTRKNGGNQVDSSIQELQRDFYITVAGSSRRRDKYGKPYGWPACVYEKVTDWAPFEWGTEASIGDSSEAKEFILDTGVSIGHNLDRTELAKKLRLYRP